jgi:hypothetical protein
MEFCKRQIRGHLALGTPSMIQSDHNTADQCTERSGPPAALHLSGRVSLHGSNDSKSDDLAFGSVSSRNSI